MMEMVFLVSLWIIGLVPRLQPGNAYQEALPPLKDLDQGRKMSGQSPDDMHSQAGAWERE
jgi:hypothetical protein